MLKYIFSASLILATLSPVANAEVLTFDDVGHAKENFYTDLASYYGYDFSTTLDAIDLVGSSWDRGTKSGEFAVLNNQSGSGYITLTKGGTFNFAGTWAKQWTTSPTELVGEINGYLNNSLVFTIGTRVDMYNYEFIEGNSIDIDSLELNLGDYFLIDDLELIKTNVVSTPLSSIFLGLGILGFGLIRKKQV